MVRSSYAVSFFGIISMFCPNAFFCLYIQTIALRCLSLFHTFSWFNSSYVLRYIYPYASYHSVLDALEQQYNTPLSQSIIRSAIERIITVQRWFGSTIPSSTHLALAFLISIKTSTYIRMMRQLLTSVYMHIRFLGKAPDRTFFSTKIPYVRNPFLASAHALWRAQHLRVINLLLVERRVYIFESFELPMQK